MEQSEASELPQLRFNFHDANLESLSVGLGREVTLSIALYSVFYPEAPRALVRFGGILNFETVRQYFERVQEDAEPGCYLSRLDALRYDHKTASKLGDLYFFLQLDHYGPLKIHCSSLRV